jgi:hypothetical protein
MLFSVNLAFAQFSRYEDYEDRLRLDISPYVWMAAINGDLTVNGEKRSINFTFDDFFKHSNLGLNGRVELKKKKWTLMFDWNYVDLIKDKIYSELTLVELSLGYRLYKQLDVFIGGRFFKSEIEYRDELNNRKGEKKWNDPIIGARYLWNITRFWRVTARADVGGFGMGSKFEWNLMGSIGYRLSNITFMASYRIWAANYENGSGDNLFIYDLITSGPGLEMIIHF